MRLGIISDTHGNIEAFELAMKKLGSCDMILHLGDVLYHGPRNKISDGYDPKSLAAKLVGMDNMIFVKGNCDSDVDIMVTGKDLTREYRIVNADEMSVLATHGYMRSIDYYARLACSLGCAVVAFGHSHIKCDEYLHGVRLINPGSVALPKDGTRSCAVIDNGEISFINLDE